MSTLTTQLIIDAGHPGIRIEVLDAEYRVRAKGYGRVEETLPTGLYTVRYLAADAVQQRDFTLRPGPPLILDETPELLFASAAPLDLTWTALTDHQEQAARLSRQPALERGKGAELFIFSRNLDLVDSIDPAKGLSLHRLDGTLVVDIARIVETNTKPYEVRWAGRNVALDPGVYRLRLAIDRHQSVEMSLVLCPNWQSQVFLLRPPKSGQTAGSAIYDLSGAAQLMARPQQGFEPSSRVQRRRIEPWEAGEDLRLAELARQALGNDRAGIDARDLRAMLDGKWNDPLLGILGVHLELMRPEADLDLAERVIERMRNSILPGFQHPDVEILALEITRRRGGPRRSTSIEAPPMLRHSWQLLVQATADEPSLILPRSLSSQIADRLWGAGAWLIWQVPPTAPPEPKEDKWLQSVVQGVERESSGIAEYDDRVVIGGVTLFKRGAGRRTKPVPGDQDAVSTVIPELSTNRADNSDVLSPADSELALILSRQDYRKLLRKVAERPEATLEQLNSLGYPVLRSAVASLLPELEKVFGAFDLEDLTRRANLDSTELAILIQFNAQRQTSSRRSKSSQSDPLALNSLVTHLGLPAEHVQRAMGSLFIKLLSLLSTSGKTPGKVTNKGLTKSAFIASLADKTNLSRKDTKAILEALATVTVGELNRGRDVTLPGLAKITTVRQPATPKREAIDPFTKQPKVFAAKPASNKVKIRAVKALKDSV